MFNFFQKKYIKGFEESCIIHSDLLKKNFKNEFSVNVFVEEILIEARNLGLQLLKRKELSYHYDEITFFYSILEDLCNKQGIVTSLEVSQIKFKVKSLDEVEPLLKKFINLVNKSIGIYINSDLPKEFKGYEQDTQSEVLEEIQEKDNTPPEIFDFFEDDDDFFEDDDDFFEDDDDFFEDDDELIEDEEFPEEEEDKNPYMD